MGTYLWNSDLVALLEELGVLGNELLGWHVLDCDTVLVVNQTQIQLQANSTIRVFFRHGQTYIHLCVRLSFLFN